VREISADRKIPVQTDQAEGGARNEAAAHSKEPAKNPDEETYNDKIDRADVRPGNWKKHGYSERPPMRRSKNVVTLSRTTAWPMMSRIATPA